MSAPQMPLPDVIYAYGLAVNEGLIDRIEAIEYLTRHRGFTADGAVIALNGWRTAHIWLGGQPS